MLGMLVLLYLAWDWARQPSTWRWLADDAGAADTGATSEVPAKTAQAGPVGTARNAKSTQGPPPAEALPDAKPPAAEPTATGPTDEDPEEQAGAVEAFQAVTDKTLSIGPEEMFAYKRLLQWVVHQPASVMRKRARTDLTLHDFMTTPDKCRGALVEMVLDARLIRSTEFQASDGTDLFEVWGTRDNTGSWLYDAVVVGLPQGMPVGRRIDERVRFVGYFFKLQAYHAAGAAPHAPPLVAPVFIGRLIWIKAPPSPPRQGDASWTIFAIVGFAMIICAHFAWMFLRPKRRVSSIRQIGRPRPGALTIEEWFEKADEGADPQAGASGHEQAPPSPANPPAASEDSGHAPGEPPSHPLDGRVGGEG